MTGVFSYISDERIELFKVAVDAASDWQGDDVGDNEKQPESYEFIILKRFPGQIPCKTNVINYFIEYNARRIGNQFPENLLDNILFLAYLRYFRF